MKRSVPRYIFRQNLAGFLFVLPVILFSLVFLVGPIFVAVFLSFTKYNILSPPKFIGLSNYVRLIEMDTFWSSLWVTAKYVSFRLLAIFILAYLMAIIAQNLKKGGGFFQTVYFMPYVFPLAVTSIAWKIFYRPRGLVESLTDVFGIAPISWLSNETWALIAVVIVTVWSGVGYYAIIMLSGLQTIPQSVNEAASIDGANAWQRFIHITLPMLKPILFYLLVIGTVNSIQGFDPFLVMTQGGPGGATEVIGLLIYKSGMEFLKMGLASAMSVILLVIILIITLVYRYFLRSKV